MHQSHRRKTAGSFAILPAIRKEETGSCQAICRLLSGRNGQTDCLVCQCRYRLRAQLILQAEKKYGLFKLGFRNKSIEIEFSYLIFSLLNMSQFLFNFSHSRLVAPNPYNLINRELVHLSEDGRMKTSYTIQALKFHDNFR